MTADWLVVVGPGSAHMYASLTDLAACEVRLATYQRFRDGESLTGCGADIAGRKIVIVQSTPPPQNDHLIALFQMIDGAVRAGAEEVQCVVPYLAYARQDREFAAGQPVSALLFTDLCAAAGAAGVITIDVHEPRVFEYAKLPVVNLGSSRLFADWASTAMSSDCLVVAPDRGARGRAQDVADRLECSTFVCEKRKHADGTAIYPPVIPDVRGRDILVVDDLCSSGSTLLPLAETLRRSGATELRFAVTHLLCSAERRSWLVAQGIAVICSDTARSDGISCAQLLLSGLESGRLASWA